MDVERRAPVDESPLRQVLGLVSFRRFLVAQFLSALTNGTLRFALFWLTLDLTDWDPAPSLIGLALGGGGLLVAVPAGAISDRIDRKGLFVRLSAVTTVVLAITTVFVATDVMTVGGVAIAALVLGALLAGVSPAVQAMVPALVPPDRLMNGVALQMISFNVATMLGALAGGLAIQLAGNAGGLGALVVIELLAVILMHRVPDLPRPSTNDPATPRTTSLRTEMREGLDWSMSRPRTRAMLTIMLLIGFIWGAVTILLPDIAKNELGAEAFAASALFAPMGLGMIMMSLRLASAGGIERRGRLLAGALVAVLGPAVVLAALSPWYAVTLLAMGIWGMGGGIVMTMQRTILQEEIPDALMGRVMGLNTVGLLGSFPLAAAVSAALTSVVAASTALAVMAGTVTVLAIALTSRPAVHAA